MRVSEVKTAAEAGRNERENDTKTAQIGFFIMLLALLCKYFVNTKMKSSRDFF
jgi:hypothetical protein